MRPKQVDEQHRMLFDREFNFGSKVVKNKKNRDKNRDAAREVEEYVRNGGDYDARRIHRVDGGFKT